MNREIQYTPNNKVIRLNNSQELNQVKDIISSPNLLPALDRILKIFTIVEDIAIIEKEKEKAANDFNIAIQQLGLYGKELDHKIKTTEERINFLHRLVEKLVDQGKFEVALEFDEKVQSIIENRNSNVVNTFNKYSTKGTIYLEKNEN